MSAGGPHIPVLIDAILRRCAPIKGVWLDGTFGAGGYTRALLDAGASVEAKRKDGATALLVACEATLPVTSAPTAHSSVSSLAPSLVFLIASLTSGLMAAMVLADLSG